MTSTKPAKRTEPVRPKRDQAPIRVAIVVDAPYVVPLTRNALVKSEQNNIVYSGYFIQLWDQIEKRLDKLGYMFKVTYHKMTNNEIWLNKIHNNQFDLIVGLFGPRWNIPYVDFSKPVCLSKYSIIQRTDKSWYAVIGTMIIELIGLFLILIIIGGIFGYLLYRFNGKTSPGGTTFNKYVFLTIANVMGTTGNLISHLIHRNIKIKNKNYREYISWVGLFLLAVVAGTIISTVVRAYITTRMLQEKTNFTDTPETVDTLSTRNFIVQKGSKAGKVMQHFTKNVTFSRDTLDNIIQNFSNDKNKTYDGVVVDSDARAETLASKYELQVSNIDYGMDLGCFACNSRKPEFIKDLNQVITFLTNNMVLFDVCTKYLTNNVSNCIA